MSGLEVLGIFFCTLIGMGVTLVVIWIIGSTWRHGDEIGNLEVKVRHIEDVLQELNKKGKTR